MEKFPPEWFDLAKYEPTRKFTRKQWRDVFEYRRELFRRYLQYTAAARAEGMDLRGYHSTEVCRVRAELTYCSRHVHIGIWPIEDVWLDCSEVGHSKNLLGAVKNSENILYDLDDLFLRRIKGEKLQDIIDDFSAEVRAAYDHAVYVDFSRTDAAIIADFKEWLQMKRQKWGYKQNVKPLPVSAVASLYPNRVLPYLDLYLNDYFHGKETRARKWRDFADVLFPPGVLGETADPVARVRQATGKMAMKILNSENQLFDPC